MDLKERVYKLLIINLMDIVSTLEFNYVSWVLYMHKYAGQLCDAWRLTHKQERIN